MKRVKTKLIALCIAAIATGAQFAHAQNLIWDRQYNSTNYTDAFDYGRAVTVDPNNGDVYVTGGIDQSNAAWPYQDKKIITIKYNALGVLQWQAITNGWVLNSTNSVEKGMSIALDGQGNVWVAGTIDNSTTARDICLIKYNTTTGVIAANYPKRYQDISGQFEVGASSIAVYNSTNVYVGGKTYDINTGIWRGIVLKDDPTGTGWSWIYTFTGLFNGTNPSCDVTDIKVDATGNNVYFTGWKHDSSNDTKCVTGKISSVGVLQWQSIYNYGALTDKSHALTLVEPASNSAAGVYIAGYSSVSSNVTNGLIVKYNLFGTQSWATNTNNFGKQERFHDIASIGQCGGTKLIYVCGFAERNTSNYNIDFSIAAYNSTTGALATCWGTNPQYYDGSHCASNSYAEQIGGDQATAIEYSSLTGRVYITGYSWELISSQSNTNITTRCYDGANGGVLWSQSYDCAADQLVSSDLSNLKNQLKLRYDTYLCQDEAYVTGESKRQHTLPYVVSFDVNTLKYGCGTCAPCGPPPPNFMTGGRYGEIKADFYPNPFIDKAFLVIDNSIELINAALYIYDVTGKEVGRIDNINNNQIIIERNYLQTCIYFYRLMQGEAELTKGKFMIQE